MERGYFQVPDTIQSSLQRRIFAATTLSSPLSLKNEHN
jgi:hypothetical protein